MYVITPEKRHGFIGELITNNKHSLFIFWVENDAEIRRFEKKVVAEDPQRLFEIMEMVIRLRKMNAVDRDEQEYLLDTYKKALEL